MSILENAKTWALDNLKNDDTLAILLVGSWARGQGTDVNDIDIIVIKQFQLTAIAHEEHKLGDFTLDIWVYDKDGIQEELQKGCNDLNQVNNTSMILSFLPDAQVWFEREPFIENLVNIAKSWSWSSDYEKFFDFKAEEPSIQHLKNAYQENIRHLEVAKTRLQNGLPISHRRKDYRELISPSTEEKVSKILDLTEKAYASLGIQRKWTEFDDARKAASTGNWGVSLASLKDVLRFIVRYELPTVPDQLLDPSIWKSIEDMKISEELNQAIQEAYS